VSELKPCPFCGAGKTEITDGPKIWLGTRYGDPTSVSVRHWCGPIDGQPSRMIERIGRDRESAIAAWNRRPEPVVTDDVALLNLIADIRAAAGDKEGRLMQSELVELIARQREECDQMRAAESDQRSN